MLPNFRLRGPRHDLAKLPGSLAGGALRPPISASELWGLVSSDYKTRGGPGEGAPPSPVRAGQS